MYLIGKCNRIFMILLSLCNAQMKISWTDICAIQINKYYYNSGALAREARAAEHHG